MPLGTTKSRFWIRGLTFLHMIWILHSPWRLSMIWIRKSRWGRQAQAGTSTFIKNSIEFNIHVRVTNVNLHSLGMVTLMMAVCRCWWLGVSVAVSRWCSGSTARGTSQRICCLRKPAGEYYQRFHFKPSTESNGRLCCLWISICFAIFMKFVMNPDPKI